MGMKRVSFIAGMAVLGYLAAFPSPAGAAGTGGVASARQVTYHGTRGQGVRVAMSARDAAGLPVVRSARAARTRHLPLRSPGGSLRSGRVHRARAPMASADTLAGAGAGAAGRKAASPGA